jgi:hypothetical protein
VKISKGLRTARALAVACGLSLIGCSDGDPAGASGTGKVAFTTWGEDYIEQEIPVDPGDGSGFVDGWTVKYAKFLVSFQNIRVGDSAGNTAASLDGAMLFDNRRVGVKPIIEFSEVPAKAWDKVSYQIAPVTADTELGAGATAADKTLMLDGGYSLYVEGTASKGSLRKHYTWGFTIATNYEECHSEQDGKDEAGIVVTNNATSTVQLTTHGDHLYYDRLQASPDPAVKTSLRFDDLAKADKDEDGELTLEELDAALLDVRLYDPSGLNAATQGAFVRSLARTIGHFRGEGECTISAISEEPAK